LRDRKEERKGKTRGEEVGRDDDGGELQRGKERERSGRKRTYGSVDGEELGHTSTIKE